jgi:LysR family transcriptional regulator, nitrogen assimilation regulatory protein
MPKLDTGRGLATLCQGLGGPPMSLRQLKYFVAVAETGSLSAGARRSNISQPALCVQIRLLEERLGASLLSRHSRGVELTGVGKSFLRHAITALEEISQGERAVASPDSADGYDIKLGMMPTPARVLVVDLLRRCEKTKSPKWNVHEGLSDELWRLVAQGQLDAALCYDPGSIKSIMTLPLYQLDFFLVGLPQTLISEGPVERAALREFPLVLGNNNMGKFVENAAAADGIELKIAFDVGQKNLKRELLLYEGCCTIAPYAQFLDEINAGMLSARPITPRLTRTVMLLLHESLSAKTREFVESTIRSAVKMRIKESVLQWHAIN